ncbi:MAG: CpXC domain-containing protein [Eggerthellaceae bacterium]|nr:CpXC domain-containing protein [Eggerthellaceae bacterium]
MTDAKTFEMTTGPYIPPEHARYGLLPHKVIEGGEVLSFPEGLYSVEELIREKEGDAEEEGQGKKVRLVRHDFGSYSEFFDNLASYADRYREDDPGLAEAIDWLGDAARRMNVKENWSIVRYIGHQHDDDPLAETHGLTRGRCYYWPCSAEFPVYEGVVDNEEFSSYLYPCDPDSWEIVEDPTGMAARALAGEAETVEQWKMEMVAEEGSIEAWAMENGISAKRTRHTSVFVESKDDGWSDSEADPFPIPCPGCGQEFTHNAWTLVNARKDPALAERLMEGTLFEFNCPKCGYTASLANPCLYLDPDNRACVYLVVNQDMAEGVSGMFDGFEEDDGSGGINGSKRRIVWDRHELRGKAVAFANGFDDRAIELVKLAVSGHAKMNGHVPVDTECVVNLVGVDGDDLVFDLEIGDEEMIATIPRDGYEFFADGIAHSSIRDEQSYFVDRGWARHATDVLEAEGVMG